MSPVVQKEPSARRRRVAPGSIAVVAFGGISPFHLAVPCLVFGEDRADIGVPRFDFVVCAAEKGRLKTSVGFAIDANRGLACLRRADVVIVPSWRDVDERPPEALLNALRAAHRRGATVVGLCLGAFVLAEAGLLYGRTATTHWHWAADFSQRFPEVQLEPSVLYVDEGRIVTSAGTAASLDCCLHLLRRWCGSEVANRVARRLVVAPHRKGGQAQFIEQPIPGSAREGRLNDLLHWVSAHPALSHSIDSLADKAAMSRRTFTRQFERATGTTFVPWLTHQRLVRASQLLETTGHSVEAVASEAGFGSAVSLRQRFVATYGLSPASYRRQFQAPGPS